MIRRLALALVLLALAVLAALFAASEWIIRGPHDIALTPIAVPHDAASVAEGARLATIVGCPSCHGNGKGTVWTPVDWKVGQIAPPPIARRIAGYSDAELARLIHHGVRKDGSTLFVMPTVAERHLADDDVARIIAWARTLKPAPDDSTATTWWGPVTRWQMLTGRFLPSAIAENSAPHARPADVGRYYVRAVCSECHGLHADRVKEGQVVPALATVAAAYTDAEFHRLLRSGVAAGDRKLGLMTTIVGENLHALNDDEVTSIHRFLQREAARSQD